jgi:ABC-type siderophore export system fused ATPase/permease subunit
LSLVNDELNNKNNELVNTNKDMKMNTESMNAKHIATMNATANEWRNKIINEKDKYDVLLREANTYKRDYTECKRESLFL